jgi:hypothetical protein
MAAVASEPASGLRVELDESHCIVIVEPRLRDDVRITVTNVEALVDALRTVATFQAVLDTLPPVTPSGDTGA